MDVGIDYFRSIQNATGMQSKKDTKVAEVVRTFAREFDNSINVIYDATRNDVPQDFIITPTKEKNKYTIFARPSEIVNIGDIIFWNKLHWLVIDKGFDDVMYTTGTIVRCNRTIRWQNPITKQIVERWCLCKNPFSSNISEGTLVSTLNGKYEVQLPNDVETIMVAPDKRFLLDIVGNEPMVYKLTFPDVDSNKYQDIDGGFIIWNLVSDAYNRETDNVELMIADYIDPGVPPTPPSPDDPVLLRCEIVGRNTINYGSTRTYKAQFFTADDVLDDSVTALWDVSGLSQHITMQSNGNSIALSVADVESVAGSVFTIKMSDSEGRYQQTAMEVEVV